MMFVKGLVACIAVHFALAGPSSCRAVKGRISSETVAPGDLFCPNVPTALCTQGTFTGGLGGDFEFVLTNGGPFPSLTFPTAVEGALTMTLTSSNLCAKGTVLSIEDASSFVPTLGDSFFGAVQRIVPNADCGIAEGSYVTTSGIFNQGCQDCVYNGVICFEA